jgi:hypothetical protein
LEEGEKVFSLFLSKKCLNCDCLPKLHLPIEFKITKYLRKIVVIS